MSTLLLGARRDGTLAGDMLDMTVKKNTPNKNAAIRDVEDVDDEPIDDDEEEGSPITPKLVGKFIRMWPRAIFSTPAARIVREATES
jgi:hypothetical protein